MRRNFVAVAIPANAEKIKTVFILYRRTAEIITLTLIMTDKNGDYHVATLFVMTEKAKDK